MFSLRICTVRVEICAFRTLDICFFEVASGSIFASSRQSIFTLRVSERGFTFLYNRPLFSIFNSLALGFEGGEGLQFGTAGGFAR